MRGSNAGAAPQAEGGPAVELELQEEPPQRPWWCYPLLAAAVLSVSSAGAVFRKMPDVPPITLAAWRLQLTSAILAVGAVAQWRSMPAADKRRALSSPDILWTAFSGACLAVHFGAWVASLKATSLPHSLLLVSMAPVLLVLLAMARREPLSRGEVGGTALALAGAVGLAAGAAVGAEGAEVTVLGDVEAFAAAVAVVGYLQVGALLRTYQPAFVYAAPVTTLAAALLTVASLATEAKGRLIGADRHGAFGWVASGAYAPYIIWLGTVSGIVGHTGFNTLLRYLSSLTISLAIQLEPLFGPVIGWAIGVSAPPSVATWAGGAVVLTATLLVLASSSKRQAAETEGRARRARSGIDEAAAAEAGGSGRGGGRGGGGRGGGGGGLELSGAPRRGKAGSGVGLFAGRGRAAAEGEGAVGDDEEEEAETSRLLPSGPAEGGSRV